MKIKSKSTAQPCNSQEIKSDIKPLIDLFELLLEWDMKDVQEKEEKHKEVS
jgi:hypothetical protein